MNPLHRYRKLTRDESYLTKLSTLLPAEIVAAYTAVNAGLLSAAGLETQEKVRWLWVIFGFFTVATIVYLYNKNKVLPEDQKMTILQITLTTISFIIWALAMGEVLTTTDPGIWKKPIVDVIVGLWTLGVPFLLPQS